MQIDIVLYTMLNAQCSIHNQLNSQTAKKYNISCSYMLKMVKKQQKYRGNYCIIQ